MADHDLCMVKCNVTVSSVFYIENVCSDVVSSSGVS